jgi:hypothetical protein
VVLAVGRIVLIVVDIPIILVIIRSRRDISRIRRVGWVLLALLNRLDTLL